MLLIARRPGESIQIGPGIEITILRASRSRVLVAINAPKELKVTRTRPAAVPEAGAERAANETIVQRRPRVAAK